MFGRRLRLLRHYQTQFCSQFHSNKYIPVVNLTVPYHQVKRNNVYSKNALLPSYTVRSYSNLPDESIMEEENESDDDESYVYVGENGAKKVTENLYCYDLLTKSDKYKKTVIPTIIVDKPIPNNVVDEILEKSYEDFSISEVLEDFKTLSCHAKIYSIKPSQELHAKLFDVVTQYVPDLIDEQLWELLKHVELWFPIRMKILPPSFMKLINAIDGSLCNRINDFSPDEMLMSCDLLYHLRRPRKSKFISKVIMKLGTKPRKMSPENYIHFMFIMNVARQCDINVYELEYALESTVDKFDGNELAIVSLAFFKTKTPIRNAQLLDKIILKCNDDMHQMGDISIAAVMKMLRYSLKDKREHGSFRKMLRTFESRIEGTSAPCLVHAGHAMATVLFYDKDIVDKIVERFVDFIPTARAKDLERMLYVLIMFNYPKDSPYYRLIVEQLRNPERTAEFRTFYKSLSTSIMYLSHAGIYPLDIIKNIMDHDYLREIYKNNSFRIGQTYLLIETALQIEAPEYKGPFLPPRIRSYLNKKYSAAKSMFDNPEIQKQTYQKMLFDISNHTREVLGIDKCIIDQLLPHHLKADIVYCVDSDNKPVSPQKFMPNLPVGTIKYAPKDPAGHRWIAVVIASYSQTFRATTILPGIANSKLRQLEKIGYTPLVVFASSWRELRTPESKKRYLQQLLIHNNKNVRN